MRGPVWGKVSLLLEKRDMLAKGEKTARRLNKVFKADTVKSLGYGPMRTDPGTAYSQVGDWNKIL